TSHLGRLWKAKRTKSSTAWAAANDPNATSVRLLCCAHSTRPKIVLEGAIVTPSKGRADITRAHRRQQPIGVTWFFFLDLGPSAQAGPEIFTRNLCQQIGTEAFRC